MVPPSPTRVLVLTVHSPARSHKWCDECKRDTSSLERHRQRKHPDVAYFITMGHAVKIGRSNGMFRCINEGCKRKARGQQDILVSVLFNNN